MVVGDSVFPKVVSFQTYQVSQAITISDSDSRISGCGDANTHVLRSRSTNDISKHTYLVSLAKTNLESNSRSSGCGDANTHVLRSRSTNDISKHTYQVS
ncbi:hypothetical protein AXFE_18020 [Acidithrix ferrooxidans]|uniref:Uncharacterized protein n=1 Tax=Acidithrix ferrooxidans TaxID=1280514 RepID=A0A0D8HHM7_9ACTN|nr:hypothetical protein AXFE_18020 [Acidithrix ferrooxidans]